MLLLALILYFSLSSNQTASGAPLHSSYSPPSSIVPRDPSARNYRSTAEIIWTCLATTFMCTWVSLHPNVPRGPSRWDNFRDRVILFGWTLLAPELVLVFAYRQWEGVRLLRKLHGDEWSPIQYHFIQMGGVVLKHSKEERPRAIELSQLDKLSLFTLTFKTVKGPNQERPVSTPTRPATSSGVSGLGEEVTKVSLFPEKDILYRSKGDELSKGLVVVQTTWFIISCCARAIQKLTITNLEVITLAYAALNGVMYFFWWNKPLNVRVPIVVEITDEAFFKRISRVPEEEVGQGDERGTQTVMDIISLPWTLARTTIHYFAKTTSKLSGSNIRKVNPLYYTFQGLSEDIKTTDNAEKTTDSDAETSTDTADKTADNAESATENVNTDKKPPKHAHPSLKSFTITSLKASAFGAIHCIAWSFPFPTPVARDLWRASSTYCAASPWLILALSFLCFRVVRDNASPAYKSLAVINKIVVFLYVPARFVLGAVAFWGLYRPQGTVNQTVDWARFMPHV